MLEDYSIMEKKPNGRPIQPPPKGGVTESKKGLDATTKPFVKYNKRRETSGFNISKNDLLRKTNLPKSGKFPDKRPKPRSHNNSCGKADSKVADINEPDIGYMFESGRKKQNLNHLLNFHFTSRAGAVGSAGVNNPVRSHPINWLSTHKHKYNKEQFLQANCQFIVKENIDYTQHLVDPDLLVDWNAIEQIRVKSASLSSCPICLDYPVAAKMTRCGHIYCWSCILHYLALSDKSWRKCPICYEAVHKKDLKSVITFANPPYSVGDEICLKLMKRERGSLLPIPVEQSERKIVNGLLSLNEKDVDTIYSKLLLANQCDVADIIRIEKSELLSSLKENEGCPEMCFIEQALELLKEREKSLENSLTESVGNELQNDQPEALDEAISLEEIKDSETTVDTELAQDICGIILEDESTRSRYESVSSDGNVESENSQSFPFEDLEISNQPSSKPFYFYQASDGQHVYLQSLNIKMLEMQYGRLDQCPLQLNGKIIEKESGSMTEKLRKRLRYLMHLPVTCQFEVVELDISNYVSAEVMSHFEKELCLRAKRRIRREREERKREKKISEEVDLKWGRHPPPKLRIDSHRQFPLCGTGSDEALNTVPSSPALSRSQSLNSLSSVSTSSTSADAIPKTTLSSSLLGEQSGPSFAQMLKSGTSQISKKDSPRDFRNNEIWPKPRTSGSESELNEYVLIPQYRHTFSDAFAVALERAELDHEQGNFNKKKKKKKQKVLFVTGMACSGK